MTINIKTEKEYRNKLVSVLSVLLLASIILVIICGAITIKIGFVLFMLANVVAPFILLIHLTSKLDEEGNYVHRRGAIIGSTVGAVSAIWVPSLWLFFEIYFYSGGGANIGLGLLFLVMPIFILMAMGLGWHLGEYWRASNEPRNSKRKDGAN